MNSLIYERVSDMFSINSQLYSVDLMESYSLTSSANRKELNIVIVPLIYCLWPSSHLLHKNVPQVSKVHRI